MELPAAAQWMFMTVLMYSLARHCAATFFFVCKIKQYSIQCLKSDIFLYIKLLNAFFFTMFCCVMVSSCIIRFLIRYVIEMP